jgi:hypothetical protein
MVVMHILINNLILRRMMNNLTEEQKALIHKLRKEVGCGMMDAWKFLQEFNWEYSKALLYLKRGDHLACSTDQNPAW